MSWITSQLALGGSFPIGRGEKVLRELEIRRVVDLRAECCDDEELLRTHGIQWLYLPTQDHCAMAQPMLWEGVAWIREGFERGEKALIHCEYGIGRSALLACCVLVSQGHSPRAALHLAKRARWQVSPSPTQLHAFLEWSAEWCARRQEVCPRDTWDDLAAVAYHHLQDLVRESRAAAEAAAPEALSELRDSQT